MHCHESEYYSQLLWFFDKLLFDKLKRTIIKWSNREIQFVLRSVVNKLLTRFLSRSLRNTIQCAGMLGVLQQTADTNADKLINWNDFKHQIFYDSKTESEDFSLKNFIRIWRMPSLVPSQNTVFGQKTYKYLL